MAVCGPALAGKLVDAGRAIGRNAPPPPTGEMNMAWKTPKIVEISVAMEINSYACAEI